MKQIHAAFLSLFLISTVDAFTQSADSLQAGQSIITFPPKKFHNPFHNLDDAGRKAPFTIRHTAINDSYFATGSNNMFRPVAYRPEEMPVWKELMTLASHIAVSAFADKRNLYYVSPR